MAFMLGAFTGGLFGGAHSAMQLVNDWNILKNQRDMREAAGAVKGALDTAPQDNGVLPTVTDRAALPDAGTTGSGYNANGQPDIESMPLPNFMKPPLSAPPKAKLAGGGKSFERGGREGMPAAAPSSPFERQGREGMPEPAPTQSLLSQGYDTFMGGVRTLGHDIAQAGRGALDTIQSYLPTSGACRLALMRQPAARGCCARSALRLCANPATCAACAANRVCRVAGMPGTPSGPAVQPPVQPATASALPAEPPSAITELGQSILRALAGGGAPGF